MNGSARRPRVTPAELVAAVLTVAGTVVRSVVDDRSVRTIVVLVVVGAVASLRAGATDDRAFTARWMLAAAVAVVGFVAGGVWTGLLLAAGLLVGDSVGHGRPFLPGLPGAPVVARSVGRAVAAPVRWLTFGLLALPVVVVPWSLGRLARLDPLWSPDGWRSLHPDRGQAARPWSRRDVQLPATMRWRRVAVLGAIVLVVVAVVAYPEDERDLPIPAAFVGAAWYPEYREDSNWTQYSSTQEPLATVRLKNARTRYVNVVDGRRTSWSPPPCECRRLTVWFYGGSTAFGLGQRDEHTIASELARAAWEDGIAVDIVNRGVLGDTHWEEAQRFAWDLTAGEPPDLVVFYDGTNEFLSASYGTRDEPTLIRGEFWKKYVQQVAVERTEPPPGAERPPVPALDGGTPEQLGRRVAARYETSRELSRTVAARAGIPAAFVWQPTYDLREPVEGEAHDEGASFARRRTLAALAALPPDVIDVAHAFDGVDQPLYYDTLHTNELGAHLVASAIYPSLRPALERLVRGETVE